MNTHRHPHTGIHTHTHTHTLIHTLTHTHSNTYTHSFTHTHTSPTPTPHTHTHLWNNRGTGQRGSKMLCLLWARSEGVALGAAGPEPGQWPTRRHQEPFHLCVRLWVSWLWKLWCEVWSAWQCQPVRSNQVRQVRGVTWYLKMRPARCKANT